jgi:hypothetical protein
MFAWIGAGLVWDKLIAGSIAFNANSAIPMSVDRVNTINALSTGFQLLVVIVIVLPAIVYAIIIARRRDPSEVYS